MVNQYLYVMLEITKDNQRFSLQIPYGAPLGLCEGALDDFKQAIEDMKKLEAEREADGITE